MENYLKKLEQWANLIEEGDEQKVDNFLDQILEQKDSPSKNGYKQVFLPGGPDLFGCISSFLKADGRGHYELTRSLFAYKNISSSKESIHNFARASRLPDLLFFDKLIYHAMSDSNMTGKPITSIGDKLKFSQFLKEQLNIFKEAILSKNLSRIYFYTGILLHAVQDLASHQGMTNPEHAYLNKEEEEESPDLSESRWTLGIKLTDFFIGEYLLEDLKTVRSELDSNCSVFPWKTYEAWNSFYEVLKDIHEFKKSALKKEPSHTQKARWFDWDPKSDTTDEHYQKVIEKINQEIFPGS